MLLALRLVRLTTLLAVLLAAGSAQAGPPGTWSRVTEPLLRNIDQVGLARTADGILHVAWPKSLPGGPHEIWHTRIAASGIVGGSNLASGGWGSIGTDPDLVVMPDGSLRLLFNAIGNSPDQLGLLSATAPADGGTWTPHGGRISPATTVQAVGATLLADGTPIVAYSSGFGLHSHSGLNSGDPDVAFAGSVSSKCCLYNPDIATDESGGQAVVAFFSNRDGEACIYVQELGGPVTLVDDAFGEFAGRKDFVSPDQRMPIVARAGGGVYLAYCKGYPSCSAVRLWRALSEAGPVNVAKGGDIEDVNVSRGPEGRLWVMWWDAGKDRIYATRTNKKATKPGPITTLKIPNGQDHVWKLFGEGSAGPLDLLASVTDSGNVAYHHMQVLPVLSLSCKKTGKGVTCTVTDAGDSVAGAKVKVGSKTATTQANGKVSIDLGPGRYKATTSRDGYAPSRSVGIRIPR